MHIWLLRAGGELTCKNEIEDTKINPTQRRFKKLLLFASNDFLGLNRHPAIAKAIAKVFLIIEIFSV